MKYVLSTVLIVDTECGSRAGRVAADANVWLVESAENNVAARAHWRQASSPDEPARGSLTTFKPKGSSPEEWAEAIVHAIEDHHGMDSQVGPYSSLVVDGAKLSTSLRLALEEVGFSQFTELPYGFAASK